MAETLVTRGPSREVSSIPWADYRAWSLAGLCRQTTDAYWSAETTDRTLPPMYAIICGRCPVRTQCLDYALNTEASDGECGVWGGTTAYQRQQLKREISRKRCPGCMSDSVAPLGTGEVCLSCGLSWIV